MLSYIAKLFKQEVDYVEGDKNNVTGKRYFSYLLASSSLRFLTGEDKRCKPEQGCNPDSLQMSRLSWLTARETTLGADPRSATMTRLLLVETFTPRSVGPI